jgi:translation initiation factor 2B subunit (eIF-2B alpha/beta/delta family)
MDLDRRVAALHADTTAGAAEIAVRAARLLASAAREIPAADATAFAEALTGLTLRILDAQPVMAPLVALAREVVGTLGAPSSGGPGAHEHRDPASPSRLAALRSGAAEAAGAFAESLPRRQGAVAAEAALHLLGMEGALLTLSRSSTVERALVEAARRRASAGPAPRYPLEVVCLESRPGLEGRTLAEALAGAGARVTLAVDAALESLIGGCDALLLGADSIGDAGFVNKIGSAAAAHAARRHAAPVIVLADTTKLLPPGFPQPLGENRPANEVWDGAGATGAGRADDAGRPAAEATAAERAAGADPPAGDTPDRPPGIHIWNRYFEAVPPELVTLVITEQGALTPAELAGLRAALPVPAALRGWATGRPSG